MDSDAPDAIRRAADIISIAESQTDDEAVRKASKNLFRLMLGEQDMLNGNASGGDFTFVLDDMKDYHHLSDFHSPEARKLFESCLKAKDELSVVASKLDTKRDAYATASASKRDDLAAELLILEADYDALTEEVATLEKQARNTEKTFLSK